MTPFENSIIENFTNGQHIVSVLRRYSFEHDLSRFVQSIRRALDEDNLELIPNVAGSILTTINDTIRSAEEDDKGILEELSRLLFEDFVLILKQSENGRDCLQKCASVLRSTCDMKGYDFDALNTMLQLTQVTVVRKKIKEEQPYYEWRSGDLSELSELAKDIQDKGIITGVINFKALFKPIKSQDFQFNAPKENIELLVILFSLLKEKKLIGSKVLSGHFVPIVRYGWDNGEKLFSKKPNKILNEAKNNKASYDRKIKELDDCIKLNCPKSIRTMTGQRSLS